jgi:acyl-CoA synthetase (NDP forming)
MNTCLHKANMVSVAGLSGWPSSAVFARAGILQSETMAEHFDFAVGFSRQPLPKGNRFAVVTKADGSSVMATDAPIRRGLELTTLRPETIESSKAKLPPTAKISTAEDAGAGFKKITNGVKQRAPGARLLGVEVVPGKGEGAHVAAVRGGLTPSQSP